MWIALLLLSIVPHDDVARESVDLAEINHFYDEHGRLIFDQVIFYDWGPPYTEPFEVDDHVRRVLGVVELPKREDWRFQCRDWRLVKCPEIIPRRDWTNGGYRSLWDDKEQMRDIRIKSIRETWSQIDPELIERLYMPKEKRRGLIPARDKPKPVTGTGQPYTPMVEDNDGP